MTKKDKDRTSHNPLLYIDQPDFECAKPSMQRVYQTSRSKEKNEKVIVHGQSVNNEEKKKVKPKRRLNVQPLGYLEDEKKKEHKKPAEVAKEKSVEIPEITEQTEPRKARFNQLKTFKQMDVDERLNYLKPFIGKSAPFICMFIFEDQSHLRGILTKYEGDELIIQIKGDESVKRKRRDLVNIFIS